MIIQTAPAGRPRLAIMMYEHTALSHQFSRGFGNDRFEAPQPNDLMFSVILHHDAGWAEFDRNPVTDQATGLPYNLVETPAEYITVTSRLSPEFNQRQHPFCGLMSSMHSWGLYNGRYGLSSMVLIDKIPPHDRPIAQKMLDGELERQKRLKTELTQDSKTSGWIEDKRLFQNYKQLQFFDTLALYFNRTHPSERGEVTFEHVPLNAGAGRNHQSPAARGRMSMNSRPIHSPPSRRSMPSRAVHRARSAREERRLVKCAGEGAHGLGTLPSGGGLSRAFLGNGMS